jgi:2-polyprenyl-6-methoxyphenol hydroxylase-like FAD-dependent oxidoreductase
LWLSAAKQLSSPQRSLEDASITRENRRHHWVEPALVEYERRRIPRTKQLVLRSRQLGIIAQFENPIMRWVRDTVMHLAPKEIAEQRAKSLLEVEILSSIERSLFS